MLHRDIAPLPPNTAAPEIKRAPHPLTPAQVKADGTFQGYASLFGIPDLGGDIVERHAFRRSLAVRGTRGIKMLYQHDPAQPIGVWTELLTDHKGLRVTGRLLPEIAKAREVHALMRAGALDGLSIGFRTIKGSRDPTTGRRHLTEIDIWEVSIVTFPMQPDARVAAVKSSPSSPATSEARLVARLRRTTHDLRRAPRITSASPSPH